LSTLLLSSELKGRIETPSFYLQTDNPEAEKALDLLLMIHGWKRYRLPEIIKGNFEKPAMEPERFTSLSGRLKDKIGDGKSRYEVYVRNLEFGLNKTITPGPDGAFRLDSLEFAEGTPIGMIGQRFIRKGETYGRSKTEIILDKEQTYNISDRTVPQPVLSEMSSGIRRDIIYPAGMSNYFLKQVTVKSDALNKSLNSREIAKLKLKNVWELAEYLGIKFSYPFIDSLMQGRCHIGVTLWGSWKCLYKDMPLALIVNGYIPLLDPGIFNYLSLSDLCAIHLYSIGREKFLGLYSYAQSYEHHTSVAILELKLHSDVDVESLEYVNGIDKRIKGYGKLDIQTDVYPFGGYQEPIAFYSPKYEKGNNNDVLIPDFRSTLYWNPNLQTDLSGKCNFSFYSADRITTYKVLIEGMTEEGEIVYEIRELVIK